MPVAAAVAMVAGSAISARGARKAAGAQAAGAERGIEENARQFDVVRELLSPYVEAGAGAFDAQKYLAANPDVAQDAYYGSRPEEHWRDRGKAEGRTGTFSGALQAYQNLSGLNGPDAARAAISGIEQGAEFGSLARQGENAILQNASATGGLRGGNAQHSLAGFRSNLLSSLIDRQLSRYSGLAEMGQNAAAGVGSSALTTGQRNAALMQQAGAAQAGGALAGGNALAGAVGGIGGMLAGGWQPSTSIPASTGYGGAGIGGGGGFGSGAMFGNQDMGANF